VNALPRSQHLMRALCFSLFAAISVVARAIAADQSAHFFPVSEGSEWIMDARLVSPNGDVTPTTAHLLIEGPVEKDGRKYHRLRTWMDFGASKNTFTKLIRADETGVYAIEEGEKDAPEQKEAAFPLKIGLSWQRTSHGGTLKDSVIGIERVTIGDTAYDNCLHLRTTTPDRKFTEDYWKAPDVGSVKSVMAFANGAKIILTLREFKPGK